MLLQAAILSHLVALIYGCAPMDNIRGLPNMAPIPLDSPTFMDDDLCQQFPWVCRSSAIPRLHGTPINQTNTIRKTTPTAANEELPEDIVETKTTRKMVNTSIVKNTTTALTTIRTTAKEVKCNTSAALTTTTFLPTTSTAANVAVIISNQVETEVENNDDEENVPLKTSPPPTDVNNGDEEIMEKVDETLSTPRSLTRDEEMRMLMATRNTPAPEEEEEEEEETADKEVTTLSPSAPPTMRYPGQAETRKQAMDNVHRHIEKAMSKTLRSIGLNPTIEYTIGRYSPDMVTVMKDMSNTQVRYRGPGTHIIKDNAVIACSNGTRYVKTLSLRLHGVPALPLRFWQEAGIMFARNLKKMTGALIYNMYVTD